MYLVASVHLSVCQIYGVQRSMLGAQLCRVQKRAKKINYQSKEFVHVSNNRADAVDELLILLCFWKVMFNLSARQYFRFFHEGLL